MALTAWDRMKVKGWDLDKTSWGYVYVGPRGKYGALTVKGQGYSLTEALDNAELKEVGHGQERAA